ncbi:MAG TPA: UDP-glucose--hexose-1-phosphate uridylyltransferase [Candidatus Dormibacteraeota bacterium]|nr:UDP-glucose--hexose-1-phosphate uridylyltransferase [Candidatus Dormibacteraeota bacterium]
MPFDLKEHPHRRLNPLNREWVLVSPHRTQRPWLGQLERVAMESSVKYDPTCYMCPGNTRAVGVRNPAYENTFVFDNDYPALLPNAPEGRINQDNLIVAQSESGICRVGCFSPRHDLTVAGMTVAELRRVVDVWADQFAELDARPSINYVQIFENRGAVMGASNPHPHCQMWANVNIPNEPSKEHLAQTEHYSARKSCLLCDYLALERRIGERIIFENQHFSVVVPFWAVWPFETLVLPRRHVASLVDLDDQERDGLSDGLKRLTARYDKLFEVSFPYSMGFHQRPADNQAHPQWHLHAHFFPPLLRSATVRKFMVGYELLGTPQRDITPETAAARLRELEDAH